MRSLSCVFWPYLSFHDAMHVHVSYQLVALAVDNSSGLVCFKDEWIIHNVDTVVLYKSLS